MADLETGPPVVPLPLPVERRLRLGPFASARDAIKFVCYAGAAATLSPFVSVYAWGPIVGVGLLFSLWRPDGEAVDEQVAWWAAGHVRQRGGGPSVSEPASTRPGPARFLRLGRDQYLTILRVGGTPVAYRPPADLERAFRRFGELLRASDGRLFLLVGTSPLAAEPLLPSASAVGAPAEEPAHTGYRELVTVLCSRRHLRRADVALTEFGGGSGGAARLEQRTAALAEHLRGLGLHPVRLEGRALRDGGRRFGWASGATDR